MHGCSSTPVLLVKAEIDSMGGVVEGEVGIANKTSPRRAAIEKVQSELRLEYDVREKRKRELEFLEKGGNPLDFKNLIAASVSVHSTSFAEQHPDQFVTSEAKGSFAFNASPHGDSVDSSGRLGADPCEPNSADNIMLFDGEHESPEGDRNLLRPSKSNMQYEKSSHLDESHRIQPGNSVASGLPRKAYERRYRSRPNRDGTRSSSTDVNPTRGSHGSSLSSRHIPMEVKELIPDSENLNIPLNSTPMSKMDDHSNKTELMGSLQDMELDGVKNVESTKDLIDGVPVEAVSDAILSETPLDDPCNQLSNSEAVKTHTQLDSDGHAAAQETEEIICADIECPPNVSPNKVENRPNSRRINGFGSKKGEGMDNDVHNSSTSHGLKNMDSESSCSQTSLIIDQNKNNESEMFTKKGNGDSNGKIESQISVPDGTPIVEGDELVKEKKGTEGVCSSTLVNLDSTSASQSQQENGCNVHHEDELNRNESALKNEVKDQPIIQGMETCGSTTISGLGRKPVDTKGDIPAPQSEHTFCVRQDPVDISTSDLRNGGQLTRVSAVSVEARTSSGSDSKLSKKVDEDSILKEAQIIEAKRRRIAELSSASIPKHINPKSQWDYVLEEMAWLANDFAQERIWKIAAAGHICSRATLTYRLRKQQNSSVSIAKKVAHTLAKSVMDFWYSVQETSKVPEQQSQRDGSHSIQAYAVRFLKYNNSSVVHEEADVPPTPDRVSDMGIFDLSWEDNFTEENLFYTVPPGAMENYKNSIKSHVDKCERIGRGIQEEVETSACGVAADFEPQDNAFYEDEGETNTYDMTMAFDGGRSSTGEQKRRQLTHAYGSRSFEVYPDVQMQCAENNVVTQQSALLAKRPGGSLNVSIPTKRVRTAARRVISPFGAGMSGGIQVPTKTEASSGDTSSFQEDQGTMHHGSLLPNSVEVESVGDFEKHLPFDSAEVSTKHKKKKKAKHMNAAYEPRWHVDSTFQKEQRDHMKKSYQLESNGSSGLLDQPVTKKPKTMRQSQDNHFETITPVGGSVPSPVASQMSNMSNSHKFIKMLGGRDRGRKPKSSKMSAGQPGSGSPWSLFEDQALVVLAHDMGPNWELVSDAINSTLQFKCIFRKAKECKERHNFLMDRTSGDGADSGEDSGSSQPYNSTLPGIPRGSARQLFQRLQGPMEEDTLKSHFEKIIIIGQKQHYRKSQDPKQIQPPHGSHTIALSQVCPNNLNGGNVLTPLDLCDATIAVPDMQSLVYQGQHSGGLAIPNQGTVTPMHPASGASSGLQGSPNMMLGNNFSSSPGSINSSARDGRYPVPRSASVSTEEQQRMQHYNQMISGRNIPQPNISAPGALPGSERGVHILPGGSGMGLVRGINRSMPIARPGFQGIASATAVNSGGMVSPGMPSTNMNSGVGSGMLRPREASHMMRPGLIQDSQRQMMMMPDLQMQGSPRNSQVSHFGGLNSPYQNQTASQPVSSHSLHHPISPHQPQVLSPHQPHFQVPANHSSTNQQQAYAIRLAKERQQQRLMQQQSQQQLQQPHFSTSSSSVPHVQLQLQLPVPSPVQSSSQVQPQTGSPLASVSSTNQQKHQPPMQGAARAQAVGSGQQQQTSKQRQRQQQQFSQANRQHPQQRQQSQALQPAKVAKGVGRGKSLMHQNIPVDHSVVNGVSPNSGSQCLDKGEAPSHLMHSQGLYSGSVPNATQSTRQQLPSQSSNQSMPQQKVYSGQAASSTKHPHQMTALSDNNSSGHVSTVAPGLPAGHQSASSLAMTNSDHRQAPSHQKVGSQNQLAPQRVGQPNRQINSNKSNKPPARDSDADKQQPTRSSTEMDTMTTLHPATSNTTNVVKNASPAPAHQWHGSEPFLDFNASKATTNLGSMVSMTSNSSESTLHVGQGGGQRPSSASSRHDVNARQQQPSQLQQPNLSTPQPQQPLTAPLHSQQQAQQPLQSGNEHKLD